MLTAPCFKILRRLPGQFLKSAGPLTAPTRAHSDPHFLEAFKDPRRPPEGAHLSNGVLDVHFHERNWLAEHARENLDLFSRAYKFGAGQLISLSFVARLKEAQLRNLCNVPFGNWRNLTVGCRCHHAAFSLDH